MIVIGAGSAGLTYAIGATGIGAKVLLVEKEKIGGDCTHYGCVPSKALIHLAKEMRMLKKYHSEKHQLNLEEAQQKVQEIVDSIYAHETPEKISALGVDVKIGNCEFFDTHTISVKGEKFSAKKIIIATGSHARELTIDGIETSDIMTNKDIFKFTGKSIAVVGTGPIGCELTQALNQFQCKTFLINNSNHILQREDSQAADFVQEVMENEGIEILHHSKIVKGEKTDLGFKLQVETIKDGATSYKEIVVDGILASIGRVPNTKGLGLEKIGIEVDNRGIFVDSSTKTSVSHIYAIGDVARNFQFTHFANHMAKVALAKSIFKIPSKIETDTPRITFTTPEIASIGSMELNEEAGDMLLYKDFDSVDRAICEGKKGFFKVVVNKKGLIKGATLVGENSSELINEIAVMMNQKISVATVSNIVHPYPSYGYGLRNMFDQYRAKGYTENKKKWVQKIFGLRGE